jgi:hypothetical protein
MERVSEEGGQCTARMEHWFGDPNTPMAKFWQYYFANKNFFSDEFKDDPVVQAVLSSDVRDVLMYEAQAPLFEEALQRLQGYYDPKEAERWSKYPDLQPQAEAEREQFLQEFVYDERPEEPDAEREWWTQRRRWQKQHPVMTWFYYYDKYLKWWGDTPLEQATPITETTGGGKPSGTSTTPPPSPPPPPPPPPGWLPSSP